MLAEDLFKTSVPIYVRIGFIQLVAKNNENYFIKIQGENIELVSSFYEASFFSYKELEVVVEKCKSKYLNLVIFGRYYLVEQPENINL